MIQDETRRAEAWKNAALYFYEKKNFIDTDDSLSKAIKLLTEADKENPHRVYGLIRLIPAVQKVNKIRISEVTVSTAKAIGDLPTPGIDDKPGTENFKKYVTAVMAINWNLYATIPQMLKENKLEAADFAGRIQKREVRILADLLIGSDTIETAQKIAAAKKKRSNNHSFRFNRNFLRLSSVMFL